MKNDIMKYLEVIKRSVNLIEDILDEGCVCSKVEEYVMEWKCPLHGSMNRKSEEEVFEKSSEDTVHLNNFFDVNWSKVPSFPTTEEEEEEDES